MSLPSPRLVLGLPAFNEIANIDPLFTRIARIRRTCLPGLSVLLYDDGSRDGTGDAARAWHGRDGLLVRVIGRTENRGLGVALRSLIEDFLHSADSEALDAFALMDCDDTMDPVQLTSMWQRIAAGTDVVVASRYRPNSTISGVPWYRRLMSQGAALIFKVMHPIGGVRDYSCGYRMYRRTALQRAHAVYGSALVEQSGFAAMVEVLVKLGRLPLRFCEIPLALAYDRKRGASKMAVGDNGARLLRLAWSWRRRRLADLPRRVLHAET